MKVLQQKLASIGLPGRCLACDLPTPASRGGLCRQCYAELPWCRSVDDPDPAATVVLAALHYQGAARDWIHRLKYRDGLVEGRVLGSILRDAVRAHYWPNRQRLGLPNTGLALPQAVVPVPMPRSSWLRRGRNQATVLATPLTRELRLPLAESLARRPHKQADQHTLNAADRRLLLADAFIITQTPPRRVAIVDDVLTTGATCAALTAALLAAGAEEVHVWCLASTDAAQ